MEEEKNRQKQYQPSEIELYWQRMWGEQKTYSPDVNNAQKPFFNLMMFPYPSAEGLHVGNMYAFTGADVYGRYQRMQGNDVLEPIGLDGFGIHSENYALKVGRHPKEQAQMSEKNYYKQLHAIGNSFDWTRTVETYDPNYYKWTQWLFIQMFKNGFAYRDTALVNWCPSCKTVLSDEQVIDGKCERCGSTVEKRELEQWFFRITQYAERLLNNIEKLDWTERVKIAQRNWIGKSEGAEVGFRVEGLGDSFELRVFTTRPDTLFGATFLVIAPEHELAKEIAEGKWAQANTDEVKDYINLSKSKSDLERTAEGKDKTGVNTGLFAINPVNSKKIPIYVADYVLSGYGTGAIMAVPAHDQRDFEFAKRYNLNIIPVIQEKEDNSQQIIDDRAFEGDGIIIGSEEWNGFHVPQDIPKVIDWLENKGLGSRKSNYHLRDWLISRQRYWGPPIPMIHCQKCADEGKGERSEMPGWFTVPEADLPVMLPDVEDWKPMGTGKAPLANHPEFFKTICPNCGGEATRETDVSDTFLDSAWYFLRYPSIDIENVPFDTEITIKWLPVDQYIGGAEHSVLHLLYSRFVTMVLYDLKYLDFEEPFSKFFAHGLIIKDGAKMSKSKGNVVVPDAYIKKFGADTLRLYLMFLGPFSQGGDFRDSGIEGMNRFVRKVWRMLSVESFTDGQVSVERMRIMHKTIKKVTKDIQSLSYNTAIASMMEWYNYLNSELRGQNLEISREEIEVYLKLLAPFAPHMTEHLFQMLKNSKFEIRNSKFGKEDSIHLSEWPKWDEKYLEEKIATVIVQVNGKKRGEVEISSQEIEDRSLLENKAREVVAKYIEGFEIKKIIYVPGKIINFAI